MEKQSSNIMWYIFSSKFVFVLLAVTACAGFMMGKLPVDQFMYLAIGAFSFYFGKKDGTIR